MTEPTGSDLVKRLEKAIAHMGDNMFRRLFIESRDTLEAAERVIDEGSAALDTALNMVEGDGMPPNWDWLRQVRLHQRAWLARHATGRNGGDDE